jgi:hypothetical protein
MEIVNEFKTARPAVFTGLQNLSFDGRNTWR